jgi:EAL domain-containing protein (putative c-di-GMP-specific phosphodiesterase class I)
MRTVAELGATWYVDDFGTGFSSISHLRDLPIRGLKLDRSFVTGIRTGDRTCIKLAQGLVGLAVGLGLETVAEGIETEFEAGALLGQGWVCGQGWLFGRPSA